MTIYKPILAAALVMFISQNSIADIYKCENPDGKTVFQNKRCAKNTNQQIFSTARPKQCYSVTNSEGKSFEVQDFWTEKQNNDSFVYLQINQKTTALLTEQIQSIKIIKQEDGCPLAKLVNTARESFDASICADIHYLTDKGEDSVVAAGLDIIKSCQNKIYADGFWTFEQKKDSIQSAYASYSKKSRQLKVLVLPFMLSKQEEDAMLSQHSIDSVLSRKSDRYAFGIILKLKEDVVTPQISDVIQFQSLIVDNKTTRVRSYDQNWRSALSIKKLEISQSAQGNTVNISWSLNDSTQQAEVNVSVIILEEN